MKFEQVVEEVDVDQLTGKKENLSNQLNKVSQQEELETQKAVDAIKQKYASQKAMLSKQIQDIDKSVTQTATTLQQQQKQQTQQAQQQPQQQPAQQPAQQQPQSNLPNPQATSAGKPALAAPKPAVTPGVTPVSPA